MTKQPIPDLLADEATYAIPPGFRPFRVREHNPLDEPVVFIPRKEPDALVLVIRSMTCTACGNVRSAPENHLFLRTKGHFTATLREESEFAHLTRETKIIHLECPRCEKCFT